MRTNRPYVQIDPDVLERVRQIDLLSYLREFEPSNLVRCIAIHRTIELRYTYFIFQEKKRRLMMKEMEAKTENRYEYRKPQEKRKQMIAPDLFEFAYVPDWYGHLGKLERLALPESWKFRKPSR